jgi:hypothetical protein
MSLRLIDEHEKGRWVVYQTFSYLPKKLKKWPGHFHTGIFPENIRTRTVPYTAENTRSSPIAA